MSAALLLVTLLLVKHFVFDFLYQPPYQWKNKGTYGHLGGILHAGQHALGTLLVLLCAGKPSAACGLALVLSEAVLHYHIDWAKMRLNALMGWGATTHNEFWVLLGVDQLLHGLTYVGIAWAVLG